MAYAYLSMGAYAQAVKNFNAVVSFCQSSGYGFIGTTAEALLCVIAVAKGNISAGVTALNWYAFKFMAQGKNYHAQASLDLGWLYFAKKRNDLAAPLIKESIALFEQLGADRHLKRAHAALNAVQ